MPSARQRKDGEAARMRLLEAACWGFAERGFREAKVPEICRRAEANPALIGYHSVDKASLYEAVWRYGVEHARRDGRSGRPPTPNPRARGGARSAKRGSMP